MALIYGSSINRKLKKLNQQHPEGGSGGALSKKQSFRVNERAMEASILLDSSEGKCLISEQIVPQNGYDPAKRKLTTALTSAPLTMFKQSMAETKPRFLDPARRKVSMPASVGNTISNNGGQTQYSPLELSVDEETMERKCSSGSSTTTGFQRYFSIHKVLFERRRMATKDINKRSLTDGSDSMASSTLSSSHASSSGENLLMLEAEENEGSSSLNSSIRHSLLSILSKSKEKLRRRSISMNT